jgi:hypothetical protein
MAKTKQQQPNFELVGEVDADDVPNWTRRPQKYGPIIEAIERLDIGRSVMFRFPTQKAASQARNTIRDYLNREASIAAHEGKPAPIPGMVTTRIVADEERGGDAVIAYFTMSPAEGVIQAPKKQQPPRRK